MDLLSARNIITPFVENYLRDNWILSYIPPDLYFNEEERLHVIKTGTTIIMNLNGFDTNPGSFVRAVLDNDLNK